MLQFKVAELQREVKAFKELASKYLDASTLHVLDGCMSELAGHARSGAGKERRWEIRPENPVRSIPSRGAYEPDDRGALNVFAEMTFVWMIKPVRGSRDRTKEPAKIVELSGLASTRIRIRSSDDNQEHAMWRMEIADPAAPGCYFHIQVLGEDANSPFPHNLSIPRFPGVLSTPFAAMEFALGELFQDDWRRRAQDDRGAREWSKIQQKRHLRHLDWAQDVIKKASGSPWAAWKAAQPSQDLFVS